MLQTKLILATSSVLCLAALSAVHAAPVIYFAENPGAFFTVTGPPVTARANFLANLTNTVQSQGFESFSVGTAAPLNLSFTGSSGALAATISGTGAINDDELDGRFNTTTGGGKYWDVSGTFVIDFPTPIAAFGFYGTDIGDFNGRVTVTLIDTVDNPTTITINHQVSGLDASLLFWGFIDDAKSYKQISFGNTAAGVDGFGFDDMVIGDARQAQQPTPPPNGVPVPGTLALAGLALAAMGALRRRR